MAIIQKKKLKIEETTFNNRWPNDLMFEVLPRLTLNSMCICKCVCKSWFSIISEFLKLYRNRWLGSSFLLSIRDGQGLFSDERYLLGCTVASSSSSSSSSSSANLDSDLLSMPYTKYYGVTQVINGLVCVHIACRVCLFNLCTGEIMKLPNSRYYGSSAQNYGYFFGFDPITRAYKLLKLRPWKSEILTLGQNMCEDSWKSIEVENFPFESEPEEESVCIDGTLYWVKSRVSFDLYRHSFGSIWLPSLEKSSAVLQFRGCLAFAYKSDSHFNILSVKGYRGTTHMFELPTDLIEQWNNLIPFGSLPTGEIMLVDAEGGSNCICSYDPESQKFERFVIGELPPLKGKIASAHISCVEANFNPLSLILKQSCFSLR